MKSILVVDDNQLNLATARTVLSSKYKVIPVQKGQQALTYLENGECDLVLLDIYMPEMDGFEVLAKMRTMECCRSIPVIFLTADNDAETEARCFKEGAIDFVTKPFIPEVMLSRVGRALELEDLRRGLADRLAQKTREVSVIKDMAQQDALTGLWNRAYTEEAVNGLLARGTPGALLMIDVDNFKSVNDNYGHNAGDGMLQALADILRNTFREGDVLCRLGGDEFIVFLKDVTAKSEIRDHALDIIAQVNDKVDERGFAFNISVSIGIAQAPENGTEFETLYICADKALYYVKRNGKRSCHFFSDKLRDEDDRGKEIVDIQYLQEFMRRADNGKGAYFLEIESFRNVYNFIRRFVDRSENDVSIMLFTVRGEEDEKAMEVLEETICTSLRRSDVAAQYSIKQSIVVLMDANKENSKIAAARILENFAKAYPEGTAYIDYDIASMDKRTNK